MKYKGELGMAVVGLILAMFFIGCQSMGFNRGVKDYQKSIIEGKRVHTWAYSYGYRKGWESRKMKHARDMKAIQAGGDGIKTPLTDGFDR